MGNEMGNQNASGTKGEENEVIDAKEKVPDAAPEDHVKGENHIVPAGETKDYHEKAGEISAHDLPVSIDSDLILPASNGREENEKEPKLSAQFLEEVSKEEEELVCGNGHDIQRAALRDRDHPEEAIAQDKIAKDDADEVENKPSANEVSADLKSDAHESTDVPTEADHSLLSRESKETEEINVSGNIRENGHLVYEDNGHDHGASAVSSDDDHYAKDKNADFQDEFTVGNGLKIDPNGEVPPELNLENPAQTTEETKLIAELDNGQNKHDLVHDDDPGNSNPGTDSYQMENEEKSSVSVDKTEEATEMTPEAGMPKEISMTTAKNEEEEKKTGGYTMENAKEEKDESYTTGNANGSDEKDTIDKQTSALELSNQGKCLDIANTDASDEDANDTIRPKPVSNVVTQNQEAERQLEQKIHSEETPEPRPLSPNPEPLDVVMQNQEAERDSEQKIHSTETLAVTPPSRNPKPVSETSFAEAEHTSEQLHEQYASGETAPFSGVVPESVRRHRVESNPEKPCEKTELRKCSSFNFGIPADARSEESDQTPLLRHETTVFRSFSNCSNATFHSANGHSSLDYEPVVIEEKTIRMERSDSHHSRGGNNAAIFTPLKQENHVGANKVENGSRSAPAKEVESPGGSGKRKPKSSFFTTCLCCTAAIR